MANHHKKNQHTFLEVVFIGLFRGIWFLITLPFKKRSKRNKGISNSDKNYIRSKRIEIEGLIHSSSDIEVKHAVMEADKLVDHILKLKGYGGETFADRLRSAEKFMGRNTYESLWYAHKIRNQIAHDNGEISKQTLITAVKKLIFYAKEI